MRLLKHGSKIGNATVIVDIVQKGNPEIRPGIPMNPKYFTDHDTGNSGRGADAKMHNRYIHNMASYKPKDTNHVSWHISLDENFIIQHLPFDEPAFHCGDGWGLNSGNRTSIGVEKCMHQGADRNKIEANAIALYVYLLKEFKFPITSVRPHQSWSGKYCPQVILNKYGFFKPYRDKIEAAYKGSPINVTPGVNSYLQNGDTGAAVKDLQEHLIKVGLKLSVDGSFGPATEKALKAFQTANSLKVDGFYGPATKSKLEAVVKSPDVKPVSKPVVKEEEEDMLGKAIVIGSLNDYAAAETLSIRLNVPIYPRGAIDGEVAKELIVVGGDKKGLKADKITNLSGGNRFETAANVQKYLK
ncbi:N-acetylmuramoyl-L-alanine amidase [Paenisporosarcina sp. OV554]|uniref:peptidoglycan recognition protein family protein n=1 Tax=Paenisporosarcina sp. OV554 TaxID=2135694 RepID=UPI000D3C5E2E|nr:N-acetylmuramoyl-L-alanine amidase [Paenisporosarcina sp. OV554]PUB12636.1 N-acetylmuramoyl-L-alanine amidase [Paenisporosarcina sp. OV554]